MFCDIPAGRVEWCCWPGRSYISSLTQRCFVELYLSGSFTQSHHFVVFCCSLACSQNCSICITQEEAMSRLSLTVREVVYPNAPRRLLVENRLWCLTSKSCLVCVYGWGRKGRWTPWVILVTIFWQFFTRYHMPGEHIQEDVTTCVLCKVIKISCPAPPNWEPKLQLYWMILFWASHMYTVYLDHTHPSFPPSISSSLPSFWLSIKEMSQQVYLVQLIFTCAWSHPLEHEQPVKKPQGKMTLSLLP